jgi:uncharacterized membrane protein YhiD involved in acid resistance
MSPFLTSNAVEKFTKEVLHNKKMPDASPAAARSARHAQSFSRALAQPILQNIEHPFFSPLLILVYVFILVFLAQPWVSPCPATALSPEPSSWSATRGEIEGANPSYEGPLSPWSRCHHTRTRALLGLTPGECDFARRVLLSFALAAAVGHERERATSPTVQSTRFLPLVSTGACTFALSSAFGFQQSPAPWDSSRVAAAIPKAIGFLGAGLAFRSADPSGGHRINGLTTAAAVWVAAALGVAVAGELYFAAGYAAVCCIVILRYGPRLLRVDERGHVVGYKFSPLSLRERTQGFRADGKGSGTKVLDEVMTRLFHEAASEGSLGGNEEAGGDVGPRPKAKGKGARVRPERRAPVPPGSLDGKKLA